jgi:hypothetical protein
MQPRDWFSVGVRLFGLWVFYKGLNDLLGAVSWLFGMAPEYVTSNFDIVGKGVAFSLMYAASYFAVAAYFVFGAEHLTRCVFSEPPPAATDVPSVE